MKIKLAIIIASILTAMISQAQPTAAVEAGYSPVNKCGMAGFSAGYNWKLLNLSAGGQANTSSVVTKGMAFNVKVGHEITISDGWYAIPYIGYAYHFNSSDNKSLNSNNSLYSFELARSIKYEDDDKVRVYISYTKTGTWQFASIGVRGLF